jgi:hypothetical protein
MIVLHFFIGIINVIMNLFAFSRSERTEMIPNVDHVIVVAILIFGIYAFLAITGVQMRWPSRRSNKTAESIYGNYVDSDRKQHPDPRQHGETWADAGTARLAIRNISSGDSAQAIPHVARCESSPSAQAKRRVRSGGARATNPEQEAWHDGA